MERSIYYRLEKYLDNRHYPESFMCAASPILHEAELRNDDPFEALARGGFQDVAEGLKKSWMKGKIPAYVYKGSKPGSGVGRKPGSKIPNERTLRVRVMEIAREIEAEYPEIAARLERAVS